MKTSIINTALSRRLTTVALLVTSLAYSAEPITATTDGIMATPFAKGVEHFVRIGQDGALVDIAKVDDKGVFRDVAADMRGKLIPAQTVRENYQSKFKPFGKLHPTLAEKLKAGPTELVVAVWLKITDSTVNVTRPLKSANIEKDITTLATKYAASVMTFQAAKKKLTDKVKLTDKELLTAFDKNLPASPFLLTKLAPERIRQLAASPDVTMLFSYDPTGIEDLEAAMEIAGADLVQDTGLTGKDVKVAVYEGSPDDTSELTIESKYSTEAGFTPSRSDHTRHVTGIIRNKGDVKGFAPQAKIFSADRSGLDALDWAIDTKKVSVVNQSFHTAAEIGDGLQFTDIYKDHKLLHYPWTLIVHAAGNWLPRSSSKYEGGNSVVDEFVNHKCFNHISVGNHNDNATVMSESSCMANPTTTHADRELPEICANGTGVTAVGLTLGGTSMASPAVVGSVALLQENQGILKIWPEGVRALMLTGSMVNVPRHDGRNEDGRLVTDASDTWWNDVRLGRDGFDGAGAMNINRSVLISNHRTLSTSASTVRGWDIGTMAQSGLDSRNFARRAYSVTIPAGNGPKTLRVGLAWNSSAAVSPVLPELFNASVLAMDLDIRVFEVGDKGVLTQVGSSLSYDNSYEVADVPVKNGKSYVIKIHRWSGKFTDWTWFGVAWDVR